MNVEASSSGVPTRPWENRPGGTHGGLHWHSQGQPATLRLMPQPTVWEAGSGEQGLGFVQALGLTESQPGTMAVTHRASPTSMTLGWVLCECHDMTLNFNKLEFERSTPSGLPHSLCSGRWREALYEQQTGSVQTRPQNQVSNGTNLVYLKGYFSPLSN